MPLRVGFVQLNTVAFLELIDASARINEFLLAGKERMALGADIDFDNVYVLGGSGFKRRTASTLQLDYLVVRMNVLLHIITSVVCYIVCPMPFSIILYLILISQLFFNRFSTIFSNPVAIKT